MVKFQVISDLHLEFYKKFKSIPLPEPTAKYLILAGDIGYPFVEVYSKFLEWCSQNYEQTYIVTGNHEYYQLSHKHTMGDINRKIWEICKVWDNVTFLHQSHAVLKIQNRTIEIIGTTFWTGLDPSQYPEALYTMNDYKNIVLRKNPNILLAPIDMCKLHNRERDWLFKKLGEMEVRSDITDVVVVTHHPPSFKMSRDNHPCYGNNLDDVLPSYKKLKLWCSGHTHITRVEQIEHILLATNGHGYPCSENNSENPDYKKDFTVSI